MIRMLVLGIWKFKRDFKTNSQYFPAVISDNKYYKCFIGSNVRILPHQNNASKKVTKSMSFIRFYFLFSWGHPFSTYAVRGEGVGKYFAYFPMYVHIKMRIGGGGGSKMAKMLRTWMPPALKCDFLKINIFTCCRKISALHLLQILIIFFTVNRYPMVSKKWK